MFGSTSLRLAAIYTAGFAVAVALVGLVTILATRSVLTEEFDTRIRTELEAVTAAYADRGDRGLMRELRERKPNPGEILFGLQTASGAPLFGPLAKVQAPQGWSGQTVALDGGPRRLRVLRQDLGGRFRLLGGDDPEEIEALAERVLWGFSLAFGAVVVIGAAGGFALSRAVQRRMAAISATAEAIIDGDLARRAPVTGGDNDLDQLAHTINRMLDRIEALMESLRQVTNDVAHDLRTPLNRLRRRLERAAARADDPAYRDDIEGALAEVDAILATFSALLRIAEVEAGARRAAFRRVDLQALARAVAEDFGPAAEDTGHRLLLEDGPPVWIDGDGELLTQLTINLVENGLRHTPPGSTLRLGSGCAEGAAVLTVADDGPGVPAGERARLFDRFYRLERSRSTSGSGLGLALVQAVARLHRAEVALEDAAPGLRARIVFTAGAGPIS